MSSQWQEEAFGPVFGRLKKSEAIAITAASTVFDLSTRTNIWAEAQAGRLLALDADGIDVYFAFNSENGGTVDPTNVTAGNATQCPRVPAGVIIEGRLPWVSQAEVNGSAGAITNVGACRYLVARTLAGTATLRITVVSEPPSKRHGA